MKSTALVCLFLSVFLSPAAMAGKLNKCTAAGGAVTYPDKPCAEFSSLDAAAQSACQSRTQR